MSAQRVEMFWSFSALTAFENCPRKYWATRVKKLVSDVGAHNIGGDEEHQSIEHFFKLGLGLPDRMKPLQPLFQNLIAAPGEQFIEYQMCLTDQLVPTKFKDFDRGWVRGAADYLKINGPLATYLDWKSGKVRDEVEDQITLTALLVFQHFPAVQQVNGGLFYYNHNKVKPHVVHRGDVGLHWNGYFSRVAPMLQAKREDHYPPTPNPLCGWCPYTQCQYNTQAARLAKEQGNKP